MLTRALAIVLALGVTVGGWLLLFGSEDDAEHKRKQARGVSAATAERLKGLSLEERVDQVLLLGFTGADATIPAVEEARSRQLGGFLVREENWTDSATGALVVGELRLAGRSGRRIPPLMVASQEGGDYRALGDLAPELRQVEIGDAGSAAGAKRWARDTATALHDAGLDLNLFPIADVATLDSPVADRAFSDDPAIAAEMAAAAVRGCGAGRLACAPAHFPGLGAASQGTDQGPATIGLDPDSLRSRDLQPFLAAFAEDAPAVVLSLGLYSAYDAVTPGALAEPIATGLLRDELGFEGLAITDDLSAGAVKATSTVPDAAIQALIAGSDLLQISLPSDQPGVRDAILAAIDSGALDRARLDEAAGRVLELKNNLGLLSRA